MCGSSPSQPDMEGKPTQLPACPQGGCVVAATGQLGPQGPYLSHYSMDQHEPSCPWKLLFSGIPQVCSALAPEHYTAHSSSWQLAVPGTLQISVTQHGGSPHPMTSAPGSSSWLRLLGGTAEALTLLLCCCGAACRAVRQCSCAGGDPPVPGSVRDQGARVQVK